MTSEYVRLSHPEKTYSHKALLQSQIELMNITKRLKEYKRLKKEEFVLKLALGAKIDEALAEIDILEKSLPRVALRQENKQIPTEDKKQKEENLTLEQEIDLIRQKLSRLQE